MLNRYDEIQKQIEALQAEARVIETTLREQVAESGTVSGFGWVARIKPGRKSTDHEAAVKATFEMYSEHEMHASAMNLYDLKEKYTTTKVTVAWAQITKAAKLDTAPFTTESEPVFVIERMD